jgi:hypothetical protein
MQDGGCLALVGDAFAGEAALHNHNRDFFSALADSGLVSISILARRASDPFALPLLGISLATPHLGRSAYIQAGLRGALDRLVNMVFCGYSYKAPLTLPLAAPGGRWGRSPRRCRRKRSR